MCVCVFVFVKIKGGGRTQGSEIFLMLVRCFHEVVGESVIATGDPHFGA